MDKPRIKCYNCSKKGYFALECKKGKSDKDQAFITKKTDWDDTSDSDKEVNYALMVYVESSSETSEMKVPHSILAFDTDDTAELKKFLEKMDVSFRDRI